MRATLAGLSLAAAVLLAACGGGGSSSTTPSVPCTLPAPLAMLYPIPSATAVPDSPQQFVFATQSSGSLAGFNAYVNTLNSLSGAGQTIATAAQIQASQVPQPAATPSFSNPTYWSITLASGFSARQTVYVWLNNTNDATCTPAGPIGSFTTL